MCHLDGCLREIFDPIAFFGIKFSVCNVQFTSADSADKKLMTPKERKVFGADYILLNVSPRVARSAAPRSAAADAAA